MPDTEKVENGAPASAWHGRLLGLNPSLCGLVEEESFSTSR